MRQAYPSDITREQFDQIRPVLESFTRKTHPRKYDLYDIFCVALYIVKEGYIWCAIPHDFPKWQNVRYHYDIWAEARWKDGSSIIDLIRNIATDVIHEDNGRIPETSIMIIDSKTI